ncbi:uncharacterized protein [Macrobrachium rosenbergii]|uniref:uncharacterized protein isoform X2 n=1 Tax=Macrobrachium rosenbergii TaxID=79674 RepID=UPI0034D6AAE3
MALQSEERKRPLLVSFGNPLLDITAVVKDRSLHDTFQLPVDGQLEVNEKQRALFNLVTKEYPVEYTAGGCALNSSRVFCWVLGEPNRVVFVGGIGKDDEAQKLKAITQSSGVVNRFVEVDDQPTGTCLALVLGACRCLCADIGAANVCEPEHVFTPQFLPVLEETDFIYVEGYFITHSFNTALQIAKYAKQHNKTFVFNLCGSYVCENHPNELAELLPYVDILFGYAEEYKTLDRFVDVENLTVQLTNGQDILPSLLKALRVLKGEEKIKRDKKNISIDEGNTLVERTHQISHDPQFNHYNGVSSNGIIEELCNGFSNGKLSECNATNKLSEKTRLMKQKFVIVTNGPKPLLYVSNGIARERLVPPISSKKIIDTTGAGDSFVGGFLAALSRGLPLEQCLDCGTWTAQQLLQQKGCTLPSYPATFFGED